MTHSHPHSPHHSHWTVLLCALMAAFAGKAFALNENKESGSAGPSAFSQPGDIGTLSYDLAFTMKEFLWDEAPVLSMDGSRAAYSVRLPPGHQSLEARFQPNGTPSSAVGARVWLTHIETGDSQDVGPPEGNCWRPSFSPVGQKLAFYSDEGGPPQVWVYDIGRRQPRRLSTAQVKAKLWVGDEARWSPDGKTVYVPLAPEAGAFPDSKPSEQAAQSSDVAAVTILRSGKELETVPQEQRPKPRADFYMRENNASMAAIDVESGEARILVPWKETPRPSVLRISPSGLWLSYLSVFKGSDRKHRAAP